MREVPGIPNGLQTAEPRPAAKGAGGAGDEVMERRKGHGHGMRFAYQSAWWEQQGGETCLMRTFRVVKLSIL